MSIFCVLFSSLLLSDRCVLLWIQDTALGKPREVYRITTDSSRCEEDRLCASLSLTSATWAALSDGAGMLYLLRTGKRGDSSHMKWEVSVAATAISLTKTGFIDMSFILNNISGNADISVKIKGGNVLLISLSPLLVTHCNCNNIVIELPSQKHKCVAQLSALPQYFPTWAQQIIRTTFQLMHSDIPCCFWGWRVNISDTSTEPAGGCWGCGAAEWSGSDADSE